MRDEWRGQEKTVFDKKRKKIRLKEKRRRGAAKLDGPRVCSPKITEGLQEAEETPPHIQPPPLPPVVIETEPPHLLGEENRGQGSLLEDLDFSLYPHAK